MLDYKVAQMLRSLLLSLQILLLLYYNYNTEINITIITNNIFFYNCYYLLILFRSVQQAALMLMCIWLPWR